MKSSPVPSADAVPFLIRDSSSQDAMLTESGSLFKPKQYTLSVRVTITRVLHFRLHSSIDGQISLQQGATFRNLEQLVDFYCRNVFKFKQRPGVAMLGDPCVRGLFNADPCMYQVDWDIARDQVRLIRKLGEGNFAEVWYGLKRVK